jgi:hypothetical protein
VRIAALLELDADFDQKLEREKREGRRRVGGE